MNHLTQRYNKLAETLIFNKLAEEQKVTWYDRLGELQVAIEDDYAPFLHESPILATDLDISVIVKPADETGGSPELFIALDRGGKYQPLMYVTKGEDSDFAAYAYLDNGLETMIDRGNASEVGMTIRESIREIYQGAVEKLQNDAILKELGNANKHISADHWLERLYTLGDPNPFAAPAP